jgi:hypothetical protein
MARIGRLLAYEAQKGTFGPIDLGKMTGLPQATLDKLDAKIKKIAALPEPIRTYVWEDFCMEVMAKI